jgi:hypothetical protein
MTYLLYRKTDKGQSEMATRANRLPQRLRAALILVDGKRTDDELHSIIPSEPESTLRWLTESGYIEVAASVDRAGRRSSSFGLSEQSLDSRSRPSRSLPGGDTVASADLERMTQRGAMSRNGDVPPAARTPIEHLKRDAVRKLTDLVGPAGETAAMRIERARSREELKPILDNARELIRALRGGAAADAFAAQFIDGLMV